MGGDDLGSVGVVRGEAIWMGLVERPVGSWRGHLRRLGLGSVEQTRVDRWLWAVRAYKTRSTAGDACRGGHVEVDGRSAKPATPVRVGSRVEALVGQRRRVLEVVRVIDKRVGAAIAEQCYVDHSPPPPPKEEAPLDLGRTPGSGRPTKRERRQLDRFRGRR